jgi:hypothetical protein
VGIKVKSYADKELEGDVRKALGANGALLDSFSATRQRDPIFYRINATAAKGPIARQAVQVGADTLIKKADEISKAQLDELQRRVTVALVPLDQQSAPAAADLILKQAAVDNISGQVNTVQGQLDAAKKAQAAGIVSGRGTSSSSSAVIATLQSQLDGLNKQLAPAQAALISAKSKNSGIEKQRIGLEGAVQSATESYITSFVSASLAAPPSKPISGRKLQLVSMVTLEVILGVAVAAALIAWQERRQLARALRTRLGRGNNNRPAGRGLGGITAPAGAHAAGRRR